MKTNVSFARVPMTVFDDTKLNAIDIAIYASIASFSKDGSAFPGIEAIAKRAHASRTRTLKGISMLERLGHLKVQRGLRAMNRNKPNIYRLCGLFDSTPRDRSDYDRSQSDIFDSAPHVPELEKKYNKTRNIYSKPIENALSLRGEDSLHEKIKQSFEAVYGRFPDYGKEGSAITRIIDFTDGNAELIRKMLETFLQLTKSNQKYWSEQPFLPSILSASGIWPRVKMKLEKSTTNISWIDELEATEELV